MYGKNKVISLLGLAVLSIAMVAGTAQTASAKERGRDKGKGAKSRSYERNGERDRDHKGSRSHGWDKHRGRDRRDSRSYTRGKGKGHKQWRNCKNHGPKVRPGRGNREHGRGSGNHCSRPRRLPGRFVVNLGGIVLRF